MKSHPMHWQGERLQERETDLRSYPDGRYRPQGKAPSKVRIFAFLMPSQGRRLSIVAFDHSKAVEVACNVWRTTPAQLILLFSYPLRAMWEVV